MNSNKTVGGFIAGVIVFFMLIGLFLCTTSISPGYAGLVYNRNGGLEKQSLGQGWHVVSPTKKVIEYPVSTETVYMTSDKREGSEDNESFYLPTSDGKQLKFGIELNYRFDDTKLSTVFTKFRGRTTSDIENTFIRGKLKSWPTEATSKFSVMEIYGNKRGAASSEAEKILRDKFSKFGIIVESFNFVEVIPDGDTSKAIQARVNALQALETEKVLKEKATLQAEKQKIVAMGDAEAKIIAAESEAKANAAKLKTITPELIEYTKVSAWNGQLSQVQGGGTPIIDLRGTKK